MSARRSTEVRRQQRRVFLWSLLAAAAVHVAVFLLVPGFRVETRPRVEIRREGAAPLEGASTYVDVTFGPPTITAPDGGEWTEPPDRRLRAERVLVLSEECSMLSHGGSEPLRGRVRLSVDMDGYAEVHSVAMTTGDPCADEVMTVVAGALRYHWLPDERFPAPVDLVQPVALAVVAGQSDVLIP